MISRRQFLVGGAGFAAGIGTTAAYGVGVEPNLVPAVRRYSLEPEGWPEGLHLRIGVLSDFHACEPWMSAERLHGIVAQMNALAPDLVALLGDFSAGHYYVTGPVMPAQWGEALAGLRAPLGSVAILGNHDWWHGPVPGMPGGPAEIRAALKARAIPLLENDVLPVMVGRQVVWIAGLADQMAHRVRRGEVRGADDLGGTLAKVTTDDPIVLLAHEPFVFPMVPRRVAVTLCGHTHGGQICLPGIGAPFSPTRRYRYGHIVERGRHLIVSGGLGESGFPVRIGVPPEIGLIELGSPGLTV
ncbi:metallophosphoesterase [Lichenihabitans sp. Uapishka_5]|uniref:metallophosphoesterase n=1 Tax=Lichenihabitans sp. Uapishka_5 TaxID=3037302 RepID=UPI0029E7D7E0|nr:metallophosphoesterase [Lichenihabitans sp. Uapishka_5]MDX7953573.1 metallophosphoesterase [Lichenihabitans sp. Uapishka_5]